MTVRDLVLEAGGLDQSALLNEARVARLPENRSNGTTAREFIVPLDSSYLFERAPDGRYFGPPGLPAPLGPSPDSSAQPYDNVLILRQPGWELQRTVAVDGEVRFPGTYTLVNKSEQISDIIKRAGGLTPEGYANGVMFYRKRDGIGRIGIELPDVLRERQRTRQPAAAGRGLDLHPAVQRDRARGRSGELAGRRHMGSRARYQLLRSCGWRPVCEG